jgi:two-component system cell cycle response regulator
VRSGEEALETVLSRRVDLVVMETTGFPGMDGFDVARILKSIPRVAHVPVLLLAPSPDRARYAFALQSGAADLLPKPLPQALLEEKVWEVLSRRGFTRSPEGAPTPREKGSGVRPVSRSKEKPKSRS